jgi:hypothetical protein
MRAIEISALQPHEMNWKCQQTRPTQKTKEPDRQCWQSVCLKMHKNHKRASRTCGLQLQQWEHSFGGMGTLHMAAAVGGISMQSAVNAVGSSCWTFTLLWLWSTSALTSYKLLLMMFEFSRVYQSLLSFFNYCKPGVYTL